MGLLKIIFFVIIAIVVFSLISTYVVSVNSPQVAHLISSAFTSFFRSSSSNSTFTSHGENFTYPGNWIAFSPSVINGVPLLSQSNTTGSGLSGTLANSSLAIIIPNSNILNLVGDIPKIISGAVSKNISLASITSILTNINLVVASDFKTPSNISNSTGISGISKYLDRFHISSLNYSPTNISGYPGFFITDRNIRIPQIDNLSFAYVGVGVAITGKTICLIFSLAHQNSSVSQVIQAFNRVKSSIKCNVN